MIITRPDPPGPGGPRPAPRFGPAEEDPILNQRGDIAGEHAEGEHAPSPRHRLRERRAYWASTMHSMGLVCALTGTLSVITGGFSMDWDPVLGPAPPAFLRNHPSALTEAVFVAEAISADITARTMRTCRSDELICVLPLRVAFNSAGKRRLIWDGRHVNCHLLKRPFLMETLQREGRALFERSSHGGTLNVSSTRGVPLLGIRVGGHILLFDVLPFGLSSAPWLFTTVMGHSVCILRFQGNDLKGYLDDLIFASSSARGAVESAQQMIRLLTEFGWLIHPTKCVGTSEAAQTFVALGTLVDLATQTYAVPPGPQQRSIASCTASRPSSRGHPLRASRSGQWPG